MKLTKKNFAIISMFAILFIFATSGSFAQEGEGGSGGGGGSTGGGGGHILMDEELKLSIFKEISVDKLHYYSTPSESNALHIPENKVSIVHAKITVKNVGTVTAINAKIEHSFDPRLSDMQLNGFKFVGGPVNYNPLTRIFEVDELAVGKELTFYYDLSIEEKGSSDETATDSLLLDDYVSKLPIYHGVLAGVSTADVDHIVANNSAQGSGSVVSSDPSTTIAPGGPSTTPPVKPLIPPALPQTGSGMSVWIGLMLASTGFGFFITRRKEIA